MVKRNGGAVHFLTWEEPETSCLIVLELEEEEDPVIIGVSWISFDGLPEVGPRKKMSRAAAHVSHCVKQSGLL